MNNSSKILVHVVISFSGSLNAVINFGIIIYKFMFIQNVQDNTMGSLFVSPWQGEIVKARITVLLDGR
jgi:hypothetical protein